MSLAQAERQLARIQALSDGEVVAPQQLEEAREARDLAASRKGKRGGPGPRQCPGRRQRAAGCGPVGYGRGAPGTDARDRPFRRDHHRAPRPAGRRRAPARRSSTWRRDGPVWLTVQPEEKNLAYLRVGQMAQASADAFPDSVFAASITRLAPAVDPARGTIEVDLLVDRPPAFLRPDMTVSINVEVARRESALVLPAETVREAESAPWVLVVRQRRAQRQPVTPRPARRGDGGNHLRSARRRSGSLTGGGEDPPGARVRPVNQGR